MSFLDYSFYLNEILYITGAVADKIYKLSPSHVSRCGATGNEYDVKVDDDIDGRSYIWNSLFNCRVARYTCF